MARKHLIMDRSLCETELLRLQAGLVEMQKWVRAAGVQVAVIFEGCDAVGKGGAIKRITEYLNPYITRVVVLPVPIECERAQWYFQRYTTHLPVAGGICLFDHSWYNRGGAEHVMGYCTLKEYWRFLQQYPIFEGMLVDDGILLCKYQFSILQEEQYKCFKPQMTDPTRRWKFSPTDLETLPRWEDYSQTRDEMFVHTDIDSACWHVVESADKRKAHPNMIHHLLESISYEYVEHPEMTLPKRFSLPSSSYYRTDRSLRSEASDYATTLGESSVIKCYMDLEDQGIG